MWGHMNKALFTSESSIWETPQWLFDELDKEFGLKRHIPKASQDRLPLGYFPHVQIQNGSTITFMGKLK